MNGIEQQRNELNAHRRAEALRRRLAFLEEYEKAKAARELLEESREYYDELFPLDAIPAPIQRILKYIGEQFGIPFGATCAALLTASSGFLGTQKARISRAKVKGAQTLAPMIQTVLIAESGAGKTPATDFALSPILERTKEAQKEVNELRLQRSTLAKELGELNAKSETERTDEENKRARYLALALALIEEGGAAYVGELSSLEGAGVVLRANELQAEMNGTAPNGYIIAGQAGQFFNVGTTPRNVETVACLFDRLDNISDGKGLDRRAKGSKEQKQGTTGTIGLGLLLENQPVKMTCLLHEGLKGDGFLNRLLFAYIPFIHDIAAEDNTPEEKAVYAIWRDVIRYENDFNYVVFYPENPQLLKQYQLDLNNRANATSRTGNAPKAAYWRKLYNIVNQIALALHIWNLATDKTDLKAADLATLDDGETVQNWAIIPAETFQKAVRLAEYYSETRDGILNLCLEYVRPKRKSADKESDIPEIGAPSPLSEIAAKVYEYAGTVGAPAPLFEPNDNGARVLTLTELRRKNYCQNLAQREALERYLQERGLLFPQEIDKYQKLRVFVPNDVSLEVLRNWQALNMEGRDEIGNALKSGTFNTDTIKP